MERRMRMRGRNNTDSDAMSEANAKEDAQVPSKEAKDEGREFARKSFGNLNSDNRPSA